MSGHRVRTRTARSARLKIEALEFRVLLSGGSAAHAAHAAHTRHSAHVQHLRHTQAVARAAALAARSALAAASTPTATGAASPPTSGTAGVNIPPGTPNTLTFHGDNYRSGFNQNETILNPSN